MERVFTRSEVARHHTVDDAWIIVGGRVYDISACLKKHAAGFDAAVPHLGKDCTDVLAEALSPAAFERMAKQCDLGRAVAAVHLHTCGSSPGEESPCSATEPAPGQPTTLLPGGALIVTEAPILRSRTLPELQQSQHAPALAAAVAAVQAEAAPSDPPSPVGCTVVIGCSPPSPTSGSPPRGMDFGPPKIRANESLINPPVFLASPPLRARSLSPDSGPVSPKIVTSSPDSSPPGKMSSPDASPPSGKLTANPRGLTVVMNELQLDKRRVKPQLNRMRSSPNVLCVRVSDPLPAPGMGPIAVLTPPKQLGAFSVATPAQIAHAASVSQRQSEKPADVVPSAVEPQRP